MNMSKVVLVQPPIEDFYLTRKRTIPYGLACIAAGIKKQGFDVDILDGLATDKSKKIPYPADFSYLKPFYSKADVSFFSLFHDFRHFGYSYEHIGAKIREKKPFMVGISSLFTAYGDEALTTAQTIKKFYPSCKIVLGGHHPTVFPEKVLACPAVDFVLRGEGEQGMAQLCQAVKTGSDISRIPGIAFKQDKGLFMSDPSWIKEFQSLPLPATELIRHEYYQRKNRRAALVVSSRGCPMRCSYCSVSAASSHAPFRQRDVESVISELEHQARDHDIGFIDFEDENLCLNKKWFIRLFSEINQLFSGKQVEFRAMNGLYPPSIDEDIVSLFHSSGFKTLNLSLGSTSKSQLIRFNRPDVRNAFETALSLAQKYGLDCVSYIIAAAPGQTAQSSLDDLLYLAQKRTLAGLSIYYPAPGSLDYKYCEANNLLPDHFCHMRSAALPLDHTTTRRQAVTLLRLSRILNFMKQRIDTHGRLPDPEIFSEITMPLAPDRWLLTEKLLQWFLHDGIIRGVDTTGKVYTHQTDHDLSIRFMEGIKTIQLVGVR